MPYIKRERRDEMATWSDDDGLPRNPGELNYALTQVILDYIRTAGLRYGTINDVLGALDGAGKEFYRRVAAPYEDQKRKENGDVYPQESDPPDSKNTSAEFATGPQVCGAVLVGIGPLGNPYVCHLPPGHGGQHTYVRKYPNA